MAGATTRPLAIALGDPSGIGPEVVAKSWDSRDSLGLPPFVAVGDARSVGQVWDGPIEVIDDIRDADSAFDVGLPVLHVAAADPTIPGRPSASGAHCSLDSLELAVGLARSAMADATRSAAVSTVGIPAEVAIRAASILVIMPPVPTAEPREATSTPARSCSACTSVILVAAGSDGLVV